MRNLKRTILAAALLISFSTAGAALGNDVSAASLQAAEPAGPVSNTGRDYRIALINAENSRGPVIHKPLKEEKENPVSRPRDVKDAGEGSTYREGAPSLRHHDREESQRLDEHRQRRFDKDHSDRDHRFDERRQHRFDKDDNDRGHRFDEHRQRRFDKDKDPGRGRPGGRHHDRGERKSAAMQPEDARF
nr:hypothetical protein [uncultured Dialister sp.]